MPDMHATDIPSGIPDISAALGADVMTHQQAIALRRRVSGSVLCVILKSTKWVKQVRNLGDNTTPVQTRDLPRGLWWSAT